MSTTKPSAKFYIYRNLTRGGFSVKHRGRVVARFESAFIDTATFSVSEAGRQRVLREGKKYVHAYVVSERMPALYNARAGRGPAFSQQVRYNPKVGPGFFIETPENVITGPIELLLHEGRCWTRAS